MDTSVEKSRNLSSSHSKVAVPSIVLKRNLRARLVHWPFLLPAMLFICIFIFFPAVYVIYLSFFKWNLLSSAPKFVGLSNYVHLASDPLFHQALTNSALLTGGMVIISLPLGLFLATIADIGLRGTRVYRTILFGPYVLPLVGSGLVWTLLFNAHNGLINVFLAGVGINGPDWLGSGHFALTAVLIVTIWQFTGYYMLIFLGGLQGVPIALKEAAAIDGANRVHVFRHVTLPAITPSIFFALIVCMIQSLQSFDQVYTMTGGGPDGATSTIVYYIFKMGFAMYNIGPATAASVILLMILAILTAIQLKYSNRWVVEEG